MIGFENSRYYILITMRKIINFLVIFCSTWGLLRAEDEDVIDISKITVFPSYTSAKLRAGYLSITPYTQSFYYILAESQSQNDPDEDPVILWLNGGPGCSSLLGFFSENGPFMFVENDTSQMVLNPNRWNKKANVLYLESPGGVGFSKATQAYLIQNDTSVAKDNLLALTQFFSFYSKFKGNSLYIAGSQYAGVYIPKLARQIIDYNDKMQEPIFNLMGLLIGNGCTVKEECTTPTYYSRYTMQYFFTRGFIEETQYNDYKSKCLTNGDSQTSIGCKKIQETVSLNFNASGANLYNIYGKCYGLASFSSDIEEKIESYHQTPQGLKYNLRCTDSLGPITVLNNNNFRAEFKIDEKSSVLPWTPCSEKLKYTSEGDNAPYWLLSDLATSGLRIIYYSGDFDANVPISGTISWLDHFRAQLGQTVKRSWRPWIVPNKIAKNQNVSGMVWELESLTFATVRGAGQRVGYDKPFEAEQILNIFLDPERGWTTPDYYLQSSFN